MYSGALSDPIEAAEADRNRLGSLMVSRAETALRSVA